MIEANPRLGLGAASADAAEVAIGVFAPDTGLDKGFETALTGATEPDGRAVPLYAVGGPVAAGAVFAVEFVFCIEGRTGTFTSVLTTLWGVDV